MYYVMLASVPPLHNVYQHYDSLTEEHILLSHIVENITCIK